LDDKKYIGQTVTHRMNKGKYRPFGYIGRFNDHISEALNNTKKKQCTYLNNAIRKYGKDIFTVQLLHRCYTNELDILEKKYIAEYKSLYPIGYNLTIGGKCGTYLLVDKSLPINKPNTKRGRNFGFTHTQETKNKMKKRLKEINY